MVKCSHHEKIGGGGWGDNTCPDCGKVERRYYSGSWDWEPNRCWNCIIKMGEEKLSQLEAVDNQK